MDIHDEVNEIRRQLDGYKYHVQKAAEIDAEIITMQMDRYGVKSPCFSKISPTISKTPISPIADIQRLNDMEEERDRHLTAVNYIDDLLDCLPTDDYDLIVDKCVDHVRNCELECRYQMTMNGINKKVARILNRLVSSNIGGGYEA